MVNTHNLANLISEALKNTNNNVRRRAEDELIETRNYDPQSFFLGCAQIISDDNNNEFIRVSACTIVSRSLSLRNSG